MKKNYNNPELEIVEFDKLDIICKSGGFGVTDGDDEIPFFVK